MKESAFEKIGKRPSLEEIEEILQDERKEIKEIDSEVHRLEKELVERTPTKFGTRDVARSFFGSLLVAFSFVLKGALVRTAVMMGPRNIVAIMIASISIIVIEIYYFGYRKIKNKKERRLGQFILKRLPTFYLISMIVAAGLVFSYGVNNDSIIQSNLDVFKVIIAVSFPASIGAGFSDLMKRY
jgi:uncharacterized membrane protein